MYPSAERKAVIRHKISIPRSFLPPFIIPYERNPYDIFSVSCQLFFQPITEGLTAYNGRWGSQNKFYVQISAKTIDFYKAII